MTGGVHLGVVSVGDRSGRAGDRRLAERAAGAADHASLDRIGLTPDDWPAGLRRLGEDCPKRKSAAGGNMPPGRGILYYLDITLKDGDAAHAREIVQALGEKRDGKGFGADTRKVHYTDLEDRAANAWKFQYLDFEDRAAALKALAVDLDRIDGDWRDCLSID
jgi:hypothetical protein